MELYYSAENSTTVQPFFYPFEFAGGFMAYYLTKDRWWKFFIFPFYILHIILTLYFFKYAWKSYPQIKYIISWQYDYTQLFITVWFGVFLILFVENKMIAISKKLDISSRNNNIYKKNISDLVSFGLFIIFGIICVCLIHMFVQAYFIKFIVNNRAVFIYTFPIYTALVILCSKEIYLYNVAETKWGVGWLYNHRLAIFNMFFIFNAFWTMAFFLFNHMWFVVNLSTYMVVNGLASGYLFLFTYSKDKTPLNSKKKLYHSITSKLLVCTALILTTLIVIIWTIMSNNFKFSWVHVSITLLAVTAVLQMINSYVLNFKNTWAENLHCFFFFLTTSTTLLCFFNDSKNYKELYSLLELNQTNSKLFIILWLWSVFRLSVYFGPGQSTAKTSFYFLILIPSALGISFNLLPLANELNDFVIYLPIFFWEIYKTIKLIKFKKIVNFLKKNKKYNVRKILVDTQSIKTSLFVTIKIAYLFLSLFLFVWANNCLYNLVVSVILLSVLYFILNLIISVITWAALSGKITDLQGILNKFRYLKKLYITSVILISICVMLWTFNIVAISGLL